MWGKSYTNELSLVVAPEIIDNTPIPTKHHDGKSMEMLDSRPMATTNRERSNVSIDWVGSLRGVPLAEVLRKVATEKRSGDLQVNLGTGIKSIYFDNGFIVFAASNLKRDRLGESLIEAGRISRHEFALASMLMKGSKRKFGQALVQAGVMSEEELGKQVAAQVNRIVMSLFKIKDGVYSFDERGNVIPVELMVSLSIYRILLEGVRHMTDGRLILSGLPPLGTLVRPSARPPFTVEPHKLKPLEQAVLRNAGKGTPLAAMIQSMDADRGLVLRACYGLFAAGLLEPADQGHRKPLKVQEETGVFVLLEIQRKFAKIQATNARQEILMEFDRLDRASEKELLGLDELGGQPDQANIQQAFETRQADWQKKRAMVEAQHTLVTKVEVIQGRLEKAYERMLEEKEQRASESSSKPIRAEVDQEAFEVPTEQTLPPLNEELFEEVGIDISSDDVMTPSSELVDTQPPEDSVASDRGDIGDDQKALSEVGEDADSLPSEAPEEIEEESERKGPSLRSGAQLTGAARVERVRQLNRDVKLHFQVRDWEHAVSLLYELVELEPRDPVHHDMLARAMARHPVMRKDAERHFIEALRLAPQNADLHFSLGLYYKSFAMHARAQTEFRTALRIRPQHEGAKKHLSTGGRGSKDPLKDMFKKIFG